MALFPLIASALNDLALAPNPEVHPRPVIERVFHDVEDRKDGEQQQNPANNDPDHQIIMPKEHSFV
jgi:hypothetical protein